MPLVFAADGKFIRTVGRIGEGPGEFKFLSEIVPIPGVAQRLPPQMQ